MLEFLETGGPQTIYLVHSEGSDSIATGRDNEQDCTHPGRAWSGYGRRCKRHTENTEYQTPFQVFARNITPLDAKGRLEYVKYDLEINCGGVKVNPGDLVLGDGDGVVVLPERHASEIISRCEKRVLDRKQGGFYGGGKREHLRCRGKIREILG